MTDIDPELQSLLEDGEVPDSASEDSVVEAIQEARQYIHDTGGATKAEIVRELEPAKNYPLGHNGVAARARGFESGFEDWWWGTVEPILERLPDVEAPTQHDDPWLPLDDPDS